MTPAPLPSPAPRRSAAARLRDVIVIGGGPSGTALAAELAAQDLDVLQLSPQPRAPFAPTYGAWWDELPEGVRGAAGQVWSDVRVYTGAAPTPLLRPYVRLDNAALLAQLLARADWSWQAGTVRGAERRADGTWTAHGTGGETWPARLLVDASGHGALIAPARFPGGPALQTASGLIGRFARPPIAPGSMVWMDYRTPAPELRGGEATFLYAMHLGEDRYFVEETSLIARPGLTEGQLRARLLARLEAQGTPPLTVEEQEWVAFPMNAAAPVPGPVLAFGAAAGGVHPISGFQLVGALRAAPGVARAVAGALAGGRSAGGEDAAGAGWAALWPPGSRAAREVHLLGVEALLTLPAHELPEFFRVFFELPREHWTAFLDPRTDARTLARTMLRMFAHAPNGVRVPLVRAALATPRSSGRALLGAAR